jgi:hypothetical protein
VQAMLLMNCLLICSSAECAPGYARNGATCEICPRGSYCTGGAAAATACGVGLNTLTTGARSVEQCGKYVRLASSLQEECHGIHVGTAGVAICSSFMQSCHICDQR